MKQRTLWAIERLAKWLPLGILCMIVIDAPVGVAQLPTAAILGEVKDSSGAVVTGVTLTARDIENGQTRTTSTSANGSYRFSALPIGDYEVEAEHSGFQKEVRRGLTLTVGQEAIVNFALQVGAVEQSIEVTAQAPLLNTTSGTLSSLVSEERIADLPLNGRNYIDLTLLQPGITQHKNTGGAGFGVGTQYSSNGAPIHSNTYLLDGANMQTISGTVSSSIAGNTMGIDGIREYRVITNSFSAEYGVSMGSQITMVTKGGTNSFHGSILEFLRNSALDARNFFDYTTAATPRRLPPFERNQFGGSVGGPIRKNKTFFFATYEGLRERLGATVVSTSIPASARQDGAVVNGVAIPQIAPVIKPLLALYPLPNLPSNGITFSFPQTIGEDFGQGRLDQNFSDRDTLFGRYTVDDARQIIPTTFPQFSETLVSRQQFVTVSENHIFSPSLLNTARFSISRGVIDEITPSGIAGPNYAFIPGQEIGLIVIGGVSTFGPVSVVPAHHREGVLAGSDDLFYTRGRHSLKFGVLINRFSPQVHASSNIRGTVNFANLTSFLTARPSTYSALTPGSDTLRLWTFYTLGFYGQDDLRVTARFTLNLGLRYEPHTTYGEASGKEYALRDLAHDAATTQGAPFLNPSLHNFSPRVGFAWDAEGNGRTAIRGGFGLLYDVADIGSSLVQQASGTPPLASVSLVNNPPSFTLPLTFTPQNIGKSLQPLDYHLHQRHMLQYNLTIERQLPSEMAFSAAYGGSRGLHLMMTSEGNPVPPQVLPDGSTFWSGTGARVNPNWISMQLKTAEGNSWYNSLQLGLTKRLSHGLQFQSSYTWSKVVDTNQSQLSSIESLSSSNFPVNPFNLKLDRGPAIFDITQNWRLNTLYRFPGPASLTWAAKLLQGWWASGILSLQSGYPFTPVVLTNRSRSGVGAGATALDRPDLVPGRNNGNITSGVTAGCPGVLAGQKLGTPNLYFDPCAFTLQPSGYLGTAARDSLRGPGLANLDFSLGKDTSLKILGEGGKLEFRAEFFNILNRPNFGNAGIGLSAATNSAGVVFSGQAPQETPLSTVGRLTGTATTSRQIQLALKILF